MNEHASLHIAADAATTADEVADDTAAGAIAAALPRMMLGREQLDLWNALIRTQGKLVHAGAMQLIYEQVAAGDDRLFRQQVAWNDAHGEHHALLALEEFSFRETHGAELTMESLGQMPEAIASVLEKSALDIIAERLQQAGLKGRQVAPVIAPAETGSIEVRVRIGGLFAEPVGFRLKGTPAALALLADVGSLSALSAVPEIASSINLPARIELGAVVLAARDVADLETGDVLLLTEERDRAPITILVAGRRLLAANHEGQWMIRETGMADEDPQMGREETDLAEIGSADQLPVRVHVELASLDLPLSQLGSWVPGALVDIGLGPLANGLPITLRVGGRKLASGNLITIDDRFAVRLSTVGMAPAKS
ncbi:FliM/FliN family flagellar motor switch protein [Rhizobium alvei]|uniref:FliM/FliN family flagellar motor switch protein n=1 Tax=Rhizobium alvei TaxID=1132659 RepID=A0ABT8YSJ9_9HYPH|nr:FliM/FliN family flagellar motor switch protein [Rhizobium alvei]MDO6966470.1 FliM/FliN family flagellar motor switch protein [Rhizobium alvei]